MIYYIVKNDQVISKHNKGQELKEGEQQFSFEDELIKYDFIGGVLTDTATAQDKSNHLQDLKDQKVEELRSLAKSKHSETDDEIKEYHRKQLIGMNPNTLKPETISNSIKLYNDVARIKIEINALSTPQEINDYQIKFE
jgi:ribosomal protein S2